MVCTVGARAVRRTEGQGPGHVAEHGGTQFACARRHSHLLSRDWSLARASKVASASSLHLCLGLSITARRPVRAVVLHTVNQFRALWWLVVHAEAGKWAPPPAPCHARIPRA